MDKYPIEELTMRGQPTRPSARTKTRFMRRPSARRRSRALRVELLESRRVLSGLAEVEDQHDLVQPRRDGGEHESIAIESHGIIEFLASSRAGHELKGHKLEVQKPDDHKGDDDEEADKHVRRSEQGVVHVKVEDPNEEVVVRQYVDYHLRETLEVEVSEKWSRFDAKDVRKVEVESSARQRPVRVAKGVTKNVHLLDKHAVDTILYDPAEASSSGDDGTPDHPAPHDEPGPVAHAQSFVPSVAPLLSGPLNAPGGGGSEGPEGEGGGGPGNGGPGGGGTPPSPPTIINFSAIQDLDVWLISGNVLDDKDPEGLTVVFGGLFAGQTDTVDGDHYFEAFLQLPLNVLGIATAQVTDSDNLTSDLVTLTIG